MAGEIASDLREKSSRNFMDFKVKEPFDERGNSPSTQLYNHAREIMDAGHIEDAIVAFQKSAVEMPHSKTYELIGECYIKLGRLVDAVPFLAAATTLNRGVRAPSLLAEVWHMLGRHYEAVEAADIALAREPKNKKALKVRADASALIETPKADG
jgi:tetratricopeptide (TPR) repeat protein